MGIGTSTYDGEGGNVGVCVLYIEVGENICVRK
jgi:hypothetical protein